MSAIKVRKYILYCIFRLCSDFGCNVVGYVLHGHFCSTLHSTLNSLVAKLLLSSKHNTATINVPIGSGSCEQFVWFCFRFCSSNIYLIKYTKGFGHHRWRYVCYTVVVLIVHIMSFMPFMKLTEER
jgi:hypothetical protein